MLNNPDDKIWSDGQTDGQTEGKSENYMLPFGGIIINFKEEVHFLARKNKITGVGLKISHTDQCILLF